MQNKTEIVDQKYMTIREVATRFRCSPDTVRRYIEAGRLNDIKWIDFFGNGKIYATRESVEKFEEKRKEQ